MIFDDLVDLLHQADGFIQGDDDLVVVGDVILREDAAFVVFEPFLADLIAADVKGPRRFRYAPEATCLRLVEPHCVAGIRDFLDLGIRGAGVGGEGVIEAWRLQKM